MASVWSEYPDAPPPGVAPPMLVPGGATAKSVWSEYPDDPNAPAGPAPTPLTPPQMGGWTRELALPGSAFAKGLTEAAALPGEAARLGTNLYSRYIGQPFAAWMNTKRHERGLLRCDPNVPPPPALIGSNPWDAPSLLATTQRLGITDRPDLMP